MGGVIKEDMKKQMKDPCISAGNVTHSFAMGLKMEMYFMHSNHKNGPKLPICLALAAYISLH